MRSSSAMLSAMISMFLLIARLMRSSSLELPFTSSFSGGTPASSAQRVSYALCTQGSGAYYDFSGERNISAR